MSAAQINELADLIAAEHLERKDLCQAVPLVRRGFRPRPRPNTAIIADRAREIRENLTWATEWDEGELP
jgi:hypothetical protein